MDHHGNPTIELRNVCKTFGAVSALEDVSITIFPHEIVGVVGENGAGKTTLMKTLVGVHVPDGGEWIHEGKTVPFPANPKDAARKGISIVYQEKGVIPSLRVYQFLLLGHEDKFEGMWGRLQTARMRDISREVLDEFGIRCDTEDFMYDLSLATQKMVEIARAVLSVRLEQKGGEGNCEAVIIMDEPTAPLTIEQRQELLKEIASMKKNCTFVFVTHIMQEVMEFMDRVYVLRDGRLVQHYIMANQAVTEDDLTRVIIGKDLPSTQHRSDGMKEGDHSGEVVLGLDSLSKKGVFYDISFELRRGECVGFFGPAGCGKSELIKAIAGIVSHDTGTLLVNGAVAGHRERAHARLRRGIGYFSGDLVNELLYDWPIRKNISILNITKILNRFIKSIDFSAERRMARTIMEKLKIKAPSMNTIVTTLSGGNKQKVTVGKWLERSPGILLVEDPTKGIDVGSRSDIYETVLEIKRRGTSMILVTDDAKECMTLCDRILIMKQGRVAEIVDQARFKEVVER